MASLVGRAGDSQAIKVLAAAKAYGAEVSFSAVTDLQAVRGKGASPFSTNTVTFTCAGGEQLTEPNAVCRYIASVQKQELSWAAKQWVDWDANCLRPASFLGGASLDAALAHIQHALSSGSLLAGGKEVALAEVRVRMQACTCRTR